MLTHAIAPAPSTEWAEVFDKNVTKRNSDGSPSEGSIVVHFGITTDMRTLTKGNLHINIFNATNEEGMTMYKVKQPKDMYEILHAGMIVALKKGKSLYAWAEITSSYYYEPNSAAMASKYKNWAHRWDYKILRMANKDESQKHEGWMKTFHMNTIEIPKDVIEIQEEYKNLQKIKVQKFRQKIQTLKQLRQTIVEKTEENIILYNKMQESMEAFRASQDELNALQRELELSAVI
jgi:hypothetical protein